MPEARVRYEAQRAIAERHGLGALEGHALANLSVLAFRQGAYEEALAVARKARERLRDAGSRLTAARVSCSEADAALFLGRLGEAYGIYEDAIAEFRAQGQRWDEAFTLSFHAWLLSHLGETDRALECVRRGLEIAAAPDARDLIPVLLMREAEIRFLLGDLERAKALAGEAQAGMQGTPRPDDPVWPLTLLGLVEERRGRPAEARERFRAAIALHPDPATGGLRAALECYAACVGGASPADAAAMLREHGHRLACGDRMTASFALWRATGDRAWLQAARADLDTWVAHAPPQFRDAMRARVRPHVEILQA
jgi:tetratricopeptide (TPR) repeat protein